MYPKPIVPHGFNHQSYFRQPVLNLKPINKIVWDSNQNQPQPDLIKSSSHSSGNSQSIGSRSGDYEHSIRVALTDRSQPHVEHQRDFPEGQTYSNNGVNHHQSNGSTTNGFAAAGASRRQIRKSRSGTPGSSVRRSRPTSRMQSLGSESSRPNGASDGATLLSASYSTDALGDYIQRERRAHTMAPLARITGPSSAPTASLFATIIAPSDAKAMKSAQLSLFEPEAIANTLTKPMVIRNDILSDDDLQYDDNPYDETDATVDDYDDDGDDETPIIVKVRYDPDAGAPPSEDLIRQAVDNRLKGSSGPKAVGEPLVLDFRKDTLLPSVPQPPMRAPQPGLQPSRSVDALASTQRPFTTAVPTRQQQQQQPNPEVLQRQRQLFQEQQQRQRQQQMMMQQQKLQEQQRQQQQVLMRKQQEQQLLIQQRKQQEQARQQQIRVMQEKQRQQQMLRQHQQEQQQKLVVQQRKEKQQLEQFLQQQKQQQLRQKFQQEQLQRQKQQQLREYQIQQQRKREQLLNQQYQQRYYSQPDQLYQQNSQSILFQNQRNSQNLFLPPMVPRLTQTVSTGRPYPIQQPTTRLPSTQLAPRAPLSFMNPTQFQNITIERLPARNVKPDLSLRHSYSGLSSLNSLNDYAPKYIPSTFIPINLQMATGSFNPPSHMQPRPHTAPSSTGVYRAASALDIPELSRDNLRNMLSQMPGLSGRQFSIEYLPPSQPEGYQLPVDLDQSGSNYPDAVVVDQLPSNIIRHMQGSHNLDAALQPSSSSETTVPFARNNITQVVTSNGTLNHNPPIRQRVSQSQPDSLGGEKSAKEPSSTESKPKHSRVTKRSSYRKKSRRVKSTDQTSS